MEWGPYIYFVAGIAMAIMLSGVAALWWAAKNGQFDRLNDQAVSIFDEEEPLGFTTDAFPSKKRAKNPRIDADSSSNPRPIS